MKMTYRQLLTNLKNLNCDYLDQEVKVIGKNKEIFGAFSIQGNKIVLDEQTTVSSRELDDNQIVMLLCK